MERTVRTLGSGGHIVRRDDRNRDLFYDTLEDEGPNKVTTQKVSGRVES